MEKEKSKLVLSLALCLLVGGTVAWIGFIRDPAVNPLSLSVDPFWKSAAVSRLTESEARFQALELQLEKAAERLNVNPTDLPQIQPAELSPLATYGQLPAVFVDQERGAIFPRPILPPLFISWHQINQSAERLQSRMNRFQKGFDSWLLSSLQDQNKSAPEVIRNLDEIYTSLAKLMQQARYLDQWIPQLTRNKVVQLKSNSPPSLPDLMVLAISRKDGALMNRLREDAKPHRIHPRKFLPNDLKGKITIPMVTDIRDPKFIAEFEGAIETHWNSSTWAKEQKAFFKIEWKTIPPARNTKDWSLENHLKRFPPQMAGITTGGLHTFTRGAVLVLGVGKITTRTLAHEFGHILGFPDCYFRTLGARGPGGLYGLSVLEWDNPLYPDDLMCDNSIGAARVEVW